MILLIDNYDSFSYNLFQQAAAIEPDTQVVRNDALTVSEIEDLHPSHIILSPGPGYPKDAGICEEVVSRLGGNIPQNNHYEKLSVYVKFDQNVGAGCPTEKISISNDIIDVIERSIYNDYSLQFTKRSTVVIWTTPSLVQRWRK